MLAILAGVVVVLLAAGAVYEQVARRRERQDPLPGRLVDVGGYRLHMTDEGTGGPAVVVIHGAGDSSYSWTHVRGEVARFTRMVTYDRPGLGSSDPGPAPDPVRTVDELHTLLTRAGVPGPYVLVGHSLGGMLARLYATRYPEQVAGMVMVDSSHESLKDDKKFRQSFAALGAMLRFFKFTAPVGLLRMLGDVFKLMPMYAAERSYYAAQLSPEAYRQWATAVYRNCTGDGGAGEFNACWTILEEADRQRQLAGEGPQFGDMPLAVLTNPGFGESWTEMHRELARRSTNSIHRISDRKGHCIQMPRPELVIDAIQHVVKQVRDRAAQVS